MNAPPTCLGVVLAGGRARRLGGRDKALLRVAGRSIVERVIGRLSPACDPILLNTNHDPAAFAFTGLTVLADHLPDHPGPLAGILAALDWAAEHCPDVALVVSAPCDCPFLPVDLVTRLVGASRRGGTGLVCAASGGRRHPVIAAWPVGLREALRAALTTEGLRKVETFAERHDVRIEDWSVAPVDPFYNVNTPDDLAEAERVALAFGL